MAEKTKEQANAVSEAVVSSVNTVANKTVEEAENIVVTTGVVRKVSLAHVLFLGSPATGGNSALVNPWVNSTRHCLTLQAVLGRLGISVPFHIRNPHCTPRVGTWILLYAQGK